MSGNNATLVRTTQFGARPLGVRGEPLHNTHAQIRDVVRRRLGERHVRLLAEPQAYPDTGRIDWYAEGTPVRAAADMPDHERQALRTEIDAMLAEIDAVGTQLEKSTSDDARLAGRSLHLAARRPDDESYLFRVGDQPVLICWGYDKESVGAILPQAFIAGTAPPAAAPAPPSVASPPPSPVSQPFAVPPVVVAAAAAPSAARSRFPWLIALLVGLLGVLLVLGASYGLRLLLPVPPEMLVTEQRPEPRPPAPPTVDPTLDLNKGIDTEREREGKLRASLASLREEMQQRQALCRPPEQPPATKPEPPKPPVVERKPEPKPEAPKPPPKPKVAEAPKPVVPPAPPPPPPAPPVTRPPPGMLPCNEDTASGGAGVTRNRHYLGSKAGPVTILYNMKRIPDQMNVYYRGRLVATTNRPTSFVGSLSFNFQPEAGDYSVVIEVVGPRMGTEWNYRLDCPA